MAFQPTQDDIFSDIEYIFGWKYSEMDFSLIEIGMSSYIGRHYILC